MHIFPELLESKLETSCPFFSKYVSMYFLRTKSFSYTNNLSIVTKIQNFNITQDYYVIHSPHSNFINFLSNVLYSYFHPHLPSPAVQEPVWDHSVVISLFSMSVSLILFCK